MIALVHGQEFTPQPDTTVVKTPLPGGVGAFVRWIFNLPSWIQATAAAIGLVIALVVVWYLWGRRRAIWTWLTTRSRAVTIALAATAAAIVIGVAAFGMVSWHYMMHNNDFCVGCHVMTPAFTRFQGSEHKKLQCHDCHQQSLYASMRQLVLWVAEKPEKIPPHAKVKNGVCAQCHIRAPGQDSVWKRVIATAGHRVHLFSDSLRGLQCVQCHGRELHRFMPVDSTCGQAKCHTNVTIRLAKMRGQTDLHCVTCHKFTRAVPENLSSDSTKQFLVPVQNQCFSCHQMRERMKDFDPLLDPHKAVCGECHNPHTQESPKVAFTTCTDAGCHDSPATLTPFHRGVSAAALADCGSCHKPHTWSVKGEKCLTCHQGILEDRPLRTAGQERPLVAPAAAVATASGAPLLPMAWSPLPQQAITSAARGLGYTGPPDFSHRRHRSLDCTSCHSTGKVHGALTVKTLGDCQSCHHETKAGRAPSCGACHTGAELSQQYSIPTMLKLSVLPQPKSRPLPFRHAWHSSLDCASCHATPVTMAIPADKTCASCHAQHHEPSADCRTCHVRAKPVHKRDAHLGCAAAGCHAASSGANALPPKRNVCLVCHQELATHKAGRECGACHQVNWMAGRSAGAAP